MFLVDVVQSVGRVAGETAARSTFAGMLVSLPSFTMMRFVSVWMAVFRAASAARFMAAGDARKSGSLASWMFFMVIVLSPSSEDRAFADIVVFRPGIDGGLVGPFQVVQSSGESAADHVFWDVVSPLAHPLRHAGDRHLGIAPDF